MSSTGFEAAPGWQWPDGTPGQFPAAGPEDAPEGYVNIPNAETEREHTEEAHSSAQAGTPASQHDSRRKHWKPRQCRICLETVLPTFHPPPENIPSMFQPAPSVTYDSEGGRLLRPCKCKGSSKYVHEECLQAWRHADPDYGRRNYWQCPTCGFRYRLERMQWGRFISSKVTQIVLTISILVVAIFILGFIADPIINLYLDPYSIFSPFADSDVSLFDPLDVDEEAPSWLGHFLKGFASLGILGFIKIFLSSPIQWIRAGGGGIGRTRTTGRERLANVSWMVVILGVLTFLYAVWKLVRSWCRRTLEKAGERVQDVQGDGDNDDSDDEDVPDVPNSEQ